MQVIILGLGPSGLFLLREVARIPGIEAIGIGRKSDIGIFSRYGKKFIANNSYELQEIADHLYEKKLNKFAYKTFISSGYFLDMIIDECPEIIGKLNVESPDLEVWKTLNNKKKFKENFPQTNKIIIPSLVSLEDAETIKTENFPVLLKWNRNYSQEYGIDFKTLEFSSKEKLIQTISGFPPAVIEREILSLQKLIKGEKFGYGGYFQAGKELMGITVKQKRQYPSGVSCFVEEEKRREVNELLEEYGRRVAKKTDYNGFVEFEFIRNEKDSKFYLVDINPRPWGWIKILKKKYPDFGKMITGYKITHEASINPQKVKWAQPSRDLLCIIKELKNKKSLKNFGDNLGDYFRRGLTIDEIDFFDPLPILGLIKVFFRRMVKKGNGTNES